MLGERYRQELAGGEPAIKTGRQARAGWRSTSSRRSHWRADSSIEAPFLCPGTPALYRKQYDAAAVARQRAQAEAPLPAEPTSWKAMWSKRGHPAPGSRAVAGGGALLLRAAERHGAAGSISRSDPDTGEATAI